MNEEQAKCQRASRSVAPADTSLAPIWSSARPSMERERAWKQCEKRRWLSQVQASRCGAHAMRRQRRKTCHVQAVVPQNPAMLLNHSFRHLLAVEKVHVRAESKNPGHDVLSYSICGDTPCVAVEDQEQGIGERPSLRRVFRWELDQAETGPRSMLKVSMVAI